MRQQELIQFMEKGKEYTSKVLAETLNRDQNRVGDALTRLVRSGFVVRRAGRVPHQGGLTYYYQRVDK